MKEDRKIFPQLLLVEDNNADILLLEEAMADIGVDIDLQVVHDGETAMAYLYHQPPFEGAGRPDLILLDLNVPRKSGFSVLADIKQDEGLKQIPVIVLSTSSAVEDINRSYQMQANCFISKPSNLDQFIDIMCNIWSFWLQTAKLPQKGPL